MQPSGRSFPLTLDFMCIYDDHPVLSSFKSYIVLQALRDAAKLQDPYYKLQGPEVETENQRSQVTCTRTQS